MTSHYHDVIIGLGSNLDNPLNKIEKALELIQDTEKVWLIKTSSYYQTKPIGYTNQPDFINVVCLIKTALTALELLAKLQSIEQQLGRVRTFQNAPRSIDLDIIDFNHQSMDTPHLILPHPRAHIRQFVMIPFAEIYPDYIFIDGRTALDWSKKLGEEDVQLL